MKKIDDFFKDKLSNRAFPFKEKAWEDMEQLLDSPSRKRRWPWLLFFSGVLLAGTFLAWKSMRSNQNNGSNNGAKISKFIDVTPREDNQIYTDEEVVQALSKTKIGHEEELEIKTDPIADDKNLGQNQENKLESNPTQKIKRGSLINSSDARINGARFEKGIEESEEKVEKLDYVSITSNDNTSSIVFDNEAENLTSISRSSEEDSRGNEINEQVNKAVEVGNSLVEDETKEIMKGEAKEERKEVSREVLSLFDFLIAKDPILEINRGENFSKEIKSLHPKRIRSIGVKLEREQFLPFVQNASQGTFGFGTYLRLPVKQRMNVQLGLHYKYLPVQDLRLKSSTVQTFNFGLQESTFQASVLSMQYLGTELIYNYQFPRVSIGFGVQLDYAINRYGELVEKRSLFPWERSSDGEKEELVSSKGLLENKVGSKWIISPEVLVNVKIARCSRLYVGVKYQLNDYLSISEIEGDVPLWVKAPLQMKIGVSYDLFEWKEGARPKKVRK